MIHNVKEAAHSVSAPYNNKDAVIPEVGDLINITLLDGKESTVLCMYDSNNMNGGYKGDTCRNHCYLEYTCVHLPLKCRDDIMFKNIDEVLESL